MSQRARLIRALHAGLVSYLLTTFVVLLVLVPWHAAHNEFPGHEHPPGTPDHVHGLEQVIGWLLVVTALVVVVTSLPVSQVLHPQPASWLERQRPGCANASRAPPGGHQFPIAL